MISTTRRIEYALGYVELGLLDEASDELEAISFEDRFTVPVCVARIEIHLAAKHWDIVVGYASRLIATNPELHNAWIAWAFALRESERVPEALAVLDRGVLIHGTEHPLFHYNLACYHSMLGAFGPAQICLKLACEKDGSLKLDAKDDPDLVPLWNHLAKSQS